MADLVPSVRLASREADNRQSPYHPVARSELLTFLVADGTDTKSETISLNGQVLTIFTAAPNIPTDANFTVTLTDEDGNVYHTEAGIADDGNVRTDVSADNIAVAGLVTVTISFTTTLSGDTLEFDLYFLLQSRI